MANNNNVYLAMPILDVTPERDLYMALPTEMSVPGTRQTYYRAPIRSSQTTNNNTGGVVERVDGATNIVKSQKGLRRLLLRFPKVFVPGIKQFSSTDNNSGSRPQLSMGFAMYDGRKDEPDAADKSLCAKVDEISSFLRRLVVGNPRMRKTLGLGYGNEMSDTEIRYAADALATKLSICRPLEDGQKTRYCYPKLVAPDARTPSVFHTFFFSPNGAQIAFADVLAWERPFHCEPFVEIEELFASKSVQSLQLRVRECVAYPPDTQASVRYSLSFPDVICDAAAATVTKKRAREEDDDTEKKEEEKKEDDQSVNPSFKKPQHEEPHNGEHDASR